MLIKNHQILFLSTLIIGTIISISSNNWFTAWLGLEINLMSMIPLMLIKLNKKMTEAAIKYFLSQALASIILLIIVMMSYLTNEMMNIESMEALIILALLIKIGAAPFHFWFPQVIELSGWAQCLILLTWQKIAPFILISSSATLLILMASAISASLGSLGGINQTKLKLILTYSSISHSGWMLSTVYLSTILWSIYFIIYSILSFTVISLLNSFHQINFISEINSWGVEKKIKFMLIFNMMSLGGLPPLLGFTSKLIVIKMMLMSKLLALIMLLISTSLISLYFYCRVIYSAMMIYNQKNLFSTKIIKLQPHWVTLSVSLNVITPILIMT